MKYTKKGSLKVKKKLKNNNFLKREALKKTPQFFYELLRFSLSVSSLILTVLIFYFLVPGKIKYSVTESYIFASPEKDSEVYLGVILPISNSYQTIRSRKINWGGTMSIENFRNADVIKFIGEVKEGEQTEIIIEYEVITKVGGVIWKASVMDFQTKPQNGIQSDHSIIQQVANKITENNSFFSTYQIYKFTIDHLVRPRNTDPNMGYSALEAYLNRSGACLESARLMVALCRAKSIPSQIIVGNIYPEFGQNGQYNELDFGHAWVDFYANGFWSMADPGMGNRFYPQLYFSRNDGNHVSYG